MKKNTFLDRVLPVIFALLIAGMGVYLTGCPSDPVDDGKNPGGEVPGTGPGGEVPGTGPGGEVPGTGPGGGGPGGSTPGSGPLSSIQFDLTGATAILVTEDAQGRAASDASNILFKVLADDSVQPLFDFSAIPNSSPPKVKYIARSPAAGKKDLYICFEQNWSYWIPGYMESEGYWDGDTWVEGKWVSDQTVQIGSFIHVKEDGKIYSIVWNEDNSNNYVVTSQNNDPVSFDPSGNLYFTVTNDNWGYNTSTSSSVIYKYDPETTQRKALTARLNGMFYENVQLSSDGAYIIVKGRRWDNNNTSAGVDFLRLIPTANPDVYTNIFFRSGGGSYIRSFALNPRSKVVYLSGENVYNYGNDNYSSGIYKIVVNGTSINDIKWSPIFDNTYNNSPVFVEYKQSNWVDGYYDENNHWVAGYYNYIYNWKDEFCDTEGDPDYDKMMAALYDYFMSEIIEFRHPKYSDGAPYNIKDKAALQKLYEDAELSLISQNPQTYVQTYPADFCYKLGTTNNTKATRIDNYSIQNMDSLFVGSNDSVWGIPYSWNSKKVLTQLINKDGKRDLYIPESMKNRILSNSVKPAASYVYFCADVNISGTGGESGFQNIYRFSYDDPETVENLFDNIRTRDKAYMEVFSYAISGNYLYFGGTQGIKILTGKIDLSNKIYTELEFGLKVTSMITY